MTLLKVPMSQVKTVQQMLMTEVARDQLAMVASKHVTPERMMRLMANVTRNSALGECDPITLLGAMMQCATLGLEPNTMSGHAFLIPLKNRKQGTTDVTLIVGYKGYIALANRAGITIDADIHYSDDPLWEYQKGYSPKLNHIPGPGAGKPLHAYAVAMWEGRDRPMLARVLTWADIEATRESSQGYKSAIQYGKDHPWISRMPAMAKKTAIRRLMSMLPLGDTLSDAMQVDSARVDFASFAMNPGAGPVIDGTADRGDDDGEDARIEADEKRMEAEKAEKARADEAAAKAKAARPKREAKPAAQPDEPKEATPALQVMDPTEHDLYRQVEEIIGSGINASTIRTGLEADFAAIQKSHPAVWAEIDRLLRELDASTPAEDDDEFQPA